MIVPALLLLAGIAMIYLGSEGLVWGGSRLATFTSADDRKRTCFLSDLLPAPRVLNIDLHNLVWA